MASATQDVCRAFPFCVSLFCLFASFSTFNMSRLTVSTVAARVEDLSQVIESMKKEQDAFLKSIQETISKSSRSRPAHAPVDSSSENDSDNSDEELLAEKREKKKEASDSTAFIERASPAQLRELPPTTILPVTSAWRRWVAAGETEDAKGLRRQQFMGAAGEFFYGKLRLPSTQSSARATPVTFHDKQRMLDVLELLLRAGDSPRAEAQLDGIIERFAFQLFAHQLLLEHGPAVASRFGEAYTPSARVPGFIGQCLRPALRLARDSTAGRKRTRSKNKNKNGDGSGKNGRKRDRRTKEDGGKSGEAASDK